MQYDINILSEKIAQASRKTLLELFENGEQYYYCALVTTWEGHAPFISAWSWEALERETQKHKECPDYVKSIKWSYADSPYCDFHGNNFELVKTIFNQLPNIHQMTEIEHEKELIQFRFRAMEHALKLLDAEGLFEKNQPRDNIGIFVEPNPPDHLITEIALRLNNSKSEIIKQWLEEAAE